MIPTPDRKALTLRSKRLASRRLVSCVLLIAPLIGPVKTVAQSPVSDVPLDYSSFQLIPDRNIFNPNRSGGAPVRTFEERPEPPRIEAFTLVGTMNYRKGPFAFFDGTSSDYRKVLQPGGTIGTYTVASIAGDQVTLAAETNRLELKVGMQLRRENDGAWQVREQAEAYASAGSRNDFERRDYRGPDPRRGDSRGYDSRRGDFRGRDSGGTARSSSPPAPSAPALSSEQENEILRRLMQQREQDLR